MKIKPIHPHRIEWEDAILAVLDQTFQFCRSDAQSLMEVAQEKVDQLYAAGVDAGAAAADLAA